MTPDAASGALRVAVAPARTLVPGNNAQQHVRNRLKHISFGFFGLFFDIILGGFLGCLGATLWVTET